MKTGDIVKISNAYSKAQNGLYVVITSPDDPTTCGRDYYLLRVTKAGKISQSDRSTLSWPLRSWSSNAEYCAQANAWNKEHAEIAPAAVADMSEIVAYFREKAEEAQRQADYYSQQWGEESQDAKRSREISAFYSSVAERIQPEGVTETTATPAAPLKFYWNGLKVNGGKLIKCFYSLDGRHDGRECVSIYARGYGDHLPGGLFPVENGTDLYTDYFETDSACLFPEHPLYKYARAAAVSAAIREIKRFLPKDLEKIGTWADKSGYYTSQAAHKREQLVKLEAEIVTLPKGHPTAADVEAVRALNLAAETARLAAEEEARQKEREEVLTMRNAGRVYIEEVAAAHPIQEGAPVVTIHWSECPAFYSWEENELRLSVAAAEIILRHYDELRAEQNAAAQSGGYDKTSFAIAYTDRNGEAGTYEGRYDLGDNDGGMIAHIRAFAESKRRPGHFQDGTAAAEISALADLLEEHTAAGRVVSVSVAPWLEEAVTAHQKAARERMKNTLEMVDMLTDEQLAAAVLRVPQDQPDIARFFLQALARRDEKKALSVFKSWKDGTGLEALDEI